MSLEAARTRARLRAAYVAQFLPAAGASTLLGYEVLPIRSLQVTSGSLADLKTQGPPAADAGGGTPPLRRAEER